MKIDNNINVSTKESFFEFFECDYIYYKALWALLDFTS